MDTSGSTTKIMLFDLALGGHHGSYIQYLLEFWYENQLQYEIDIIVVPEFLTVHKDVIALAERWDDPRIQIICISQPEAEQLAQKHSRLQRFYRNLQEWQLFCRYAKKYEAAQALILYLDTCEIPLALRLPSPCAFSGIYFRPTFHYNNFEGFKPSKKALFQQKRERFTLARTLGHSQLATLFCLDPFAVNQIKLCMHPKANVVHLPDPVRLNPLITITSESLRNFLHIEPQRKVFMLFGALEKRKGIDELLKSVTLLSPELNKQLCLVIAGGTNTQEQKRIRSQIDAIKQLHTVQIVENYEFIAETEVPAYFHLADVILAPYQCHVGMSGILLWAASVGKPVLSSDYGLMGEIVRRYCLGLAVDSTEPAEIAKGLARCLQETAEQISDQQLMRSFVEQNSFEYFANTIFQNIFKNSKNSQSSNTKEKI